jgi:uncharacterized RDD family membrane protein YckC
VEPEGRKEAYAGALSRIVAYSIDCLLLAVVLAACQGILYGVNPIISMTRSGQQPTAGQLHLWVFATVTFPSFLYFSLMLITTKRSTVGMRVLRVRVTDVNGGRIKFAQALLRSAVLLIPFELNHTVMFNLLPPGGPPPMAFWLGVVGVGTVIAVYVAAVLLTRRHQSLHDLIAGTVVQRVV